MRCAFVTCVELGLACMQEIYRVGGALDLVITLHDQLARSKSGRVHVDEFARQHGIDVVKIRNINDPDAIEAIRAHGIDWLFIVGWSQIARAGVLAAPSRGALGMHPTLLPEGRGRAAIPWAIIKGLDRTGVTLFKLDEGVDTGPILGQEVLRIGPVETATTLYARVAEAHRTLIARLWPDLVTDRIVWTPQDESAATEWPGRTPEDGAVLSTMSRGDVDRLVRATTHPYPGAFFDVDEVRYRIWQGRPVDERLDVPVQGHGTVLRIGLADGCFEATDWAAEPRPVTR